MSLRQLTKSEVPCLPINAPHRRYRCRLLLNRYHMLLDRISNNDILYYYYFVTLFSVFLEKEII